MMANIIKSKDAAKIERNLLDAAQLMRSLSNQNRLLIVCLLVEGEHSVSDLEDKLKIKQPILSQQLAELRDAGIVEPRREAKSVFYRLSDAKTTRLISALYDIFCGDTVMGALSIPTMKLPASVQAAVFAQVLATDKNRGRKS